MLICLEMKCAKNQSRKKWVKRTICRLIRSPICFFSFLSNCLGIWTSSNLLWQMTTEISSAYLTIIISNKMVIFFSALIYSELWISSGAKPNYGTLERISIKKLAGEGMSPTSPQTSMISSTDVAGSKSSWKVDRTLALVWNNKIYFC